jgi:ribosome recycling factor
VTSSGETPEVDDVLAEAADKMGKAVAHTQSEFAGIRTGRATPALVDGFSVPEARVLVISPYDKGSLRAIERAIQNSDLSINPSNDGQVIRLVFPQLTQERRKELVKVVRHKAEEGRIATRNVRREARRELEHREKDGEMSADDLDRAEKELEKLTHEYVAEIDRMLARKEQELLEV